MSEILNRYKRWKPRFILNKDRYLDFVLSMDNSTTIDLDGKMKENCLIAYIDMNNSECIGNNGSIQSTSGYTYYGAINSGVTMDDIGFTAVDNGLITYDKDAITFEEFVTLISKTTAKLNDGDIRLHLQPVRGNSKYYTYDSNIVYDSGETYYAMQGGFLQGFYKLEGFNYQVLPQDIDDCWNLEFVIRPRTDYIATGNTLNDEHPENKGIFFYMGSRSENKFGRFYGEDLSKYPNRESYSGDCYSYCSGSTDGWNEESEENIDRKKLFEFLYNYLKRPLYDDTGHIVGYTSPDDIDFDNFNSEIEKIASGVTICNVKLETSEGHELDTNKYYTITTDNKFLIFDRTKEGYTTKTWHEGDVMTIIQEKRGNGENLFLLMNRTKDGYTTKTIDEYYDSLTGQCSEYNIMNDVKDNSFALKINEDGSIGYKYLIKDCDNENGYSIKEEYSFPNIITMDDWNVVNVMFKIVRGETDKCGLSFGNRKMRIYIYVNGYLKLVSKELPEFRFRALNDDYEKQEGVPFNISLGGGTQGLAESMWVDNYQNPNCKVLPLEENFGGSFLGDIKSFKFYDCQMQYFDIKNNYLFEHGKN